MGGQLLLRRLRPEWAEHRVAPLALGITLLAVLTALPFVGGLVNIIAILMGLGALWLYGRKLVQKNAHRTNPAGILTTGILGHPFGVTTAPERPAVLEQRKPSSLPALTPRCGASPAHLPPSGVAFGALRSPDGRGKFLVKKHPNPLLALPPQGVGEG